MKLRMLVIALIGALGSGCASTDKGPRAYQVDPVSKVSHGSPNAQSYYQLGRYYHGQKRFDMAEAAYRKSLTLDGNQAAAHNALGSLYGEKGDLARSVQHFEKALAVAPNAGYLHNNLGFAYFLLGRFEEAYVAVRKALSLDATLERGWANLQRIADHRTETQIAATAKSLQPEALPTAPPARPTPSEVAVSTEVTAPPTPAPAGMTIVDASGTRTVGLKSDVTVSAVANMETPVLSPLAGQSDERPENGRFVLVSTSRDVVNLAEPLLIAKAEPTVPPPERTPEPASTLRPTRSPDVDFSSVAVEISNANGVGGFARKLGAQLRADHIPVRRITNHTTFLLKETAVEYQPGYQEAANALIRRLQLDVLPIPAERPRERSDVRILLGRDAVPALKPLIAKAS